MMSSEITDALKVMGLGTHGVLLYDSKESKREILFSHLQCGQPHSKMVYVCSEEGPAEIRKEMWGFGIDVGRLAESGRLSISNYDEVYIGRDGGVDVRRIADRLSGLAWGCRSQGLRSVRMASEMSFFFRNGKAVELLEYERALGREFDFPGMVVCAYNVAEMRDTGCLDMLMPMLRAHGLVMLTGPRGMVTLEPKRVENRYVEHVMRVRV